jgi:hypothetical protein
LLAGTALAHLTGGTEQDVQSVHSVGFVSRLSVHIQHLTPHVTGSGLAEVDLSLDGGLQGLDVMENHWEGDETSRNGHSGQNNGTKGRSSEIGRSLHLLGLFVFAHFRCVDTSID